MISDEEFTKLIKSVVVSDELLADTIKVSRPTITRWKEGRNLPHPIMREGIKKFIEENSWTLGVK